jgi:hypothetical protein
MLRGTLIATSLLALFALAGCDASTRDGGPGADARTQDNRDAAPAGMDASPTGTDAAAGPDISEGVDVGPLDGGGAEDAVTGSDAAAAEDAGPAADATEPDAANLDAAEADAAAADATAADASPDAGADAGTDAGVIIADGGIADAAAVDVGPYTPPVTVAACAAPLVTTALTLTSTGASAGAADSSPALSWNGALDVGLVYALKRTGTSTTAIIVQRFTSAGVPVGSRVLVDTSPKNNPPTAIAVGPTAAVVCYEASPGTPSIHCATLGRTSASALAGDSFGGAGNPVLASRGSYAALAYTRSSGAYVQAIGFDAIAIGTEIQVDSNVARGIDIAPTTSGFAATVTRTDNTVWLYRLDPLLTPLGRQTLPSATSLDTAASGTYGDEVWSVYSDGTQVESTTVPSLAAQPTTPVVVSSSSTAPARPGVESAAGALSSAGVTWFTSRGFVAYRAINAAGAPLGTALEIAGARAEHDIIAVPDGFLLAAQAPGTTTSTAVNVYHLTCP